jgi:probable HAF family extracellular repeat protein
MILSVVALTVATAGAQQQTAPQLEAQARAAQPPWTFISFDVPQAKSSSAWGINGDGAVVGTFTDTAGKQHGYLLIGGVFTTIDYPNALSTVARGINNHGDIVGWHVDAKGLPGGGMRGFLLQHGVFTDVIDPKHLNSMPMRITDDGPIVGCVHDADTMGTMHGFVFSNGKFSELSTPASMSNGVTPDGSMTAGFYFPDTTNDNFDRGYIAGGGNLAPFDYPFSTFTDVWDINASAEVVGDYGDAAGNEHGFLLTPSLVDPTFGITPPAGISLSYNFVSIDYPAATLTQANGINRHGDVVGLYEDSAGAQHAFLLLQARRRTR